MYFISLFDIVSVVVQDPNTFLCIPASAADNVAVNPNGIKTQLANGFITFFINGSPVFENGPKLISVDKSFGITLRRFATCLLVNNPKTTSVLFFIADFNFFSCEFDSFAFKLLYCIDKN